MFGQHNCLLLLEFSFLSLAKGRTINKVGEGGERGGVTNFKLNHAFFFTIKNRANIFFYM